jgi:hypothetical protein
MRRLAEACTREKIGTGQQWVSWIGIDDLLDIYYRAWWTPLSRTCLTLRMPFIGAGRTVQPGRA